MASDPTYIWRQKPLRVEIARVLIATGYPCLSAREIADAMGRDASNVKDVVEELAELKLLDRHALPARLREGPGRKAQWAYSLSLKERSVVEPLVSVSPEVTLLAGLSVAFVDLRNPEAVAEILSQPDVLTEATWFALSDGQPQEYVIAFRGQHAAARSLSLVASLQAAGVAARRSHISEVASASLLAARAQDELRAASAARIRHRTRRASG